MSFDEVWTQVQGLPEMAKLQVPEILSEKTKWKLGMISPSDVSVIVAEAIEEIKINHGSVKGLDELVRKRIYKDEL